MSTDLDKKQITAHFKINHVAKYLRMMQSSKSLREKQTKQYHLFARNWDGGPVTM